VEGRVHFLGVRDDVPQLLMISDLMLFPSLWEGLPGAVLEACAAGTPVLASDIPGVVELKQDFSEIYCINLKESDNHWVMKVKSLLNNKKLAEDRLMFLYKFEQSIYNIKGCMSSYCIVWAGEKNYIIKNIGNLSFVREK
jgi:glycosyltransferase involved in cell wall biosynthesis